MSFCTSRSAWPLGSLVRTTGLNSKGSLNSFGGVTLISRFFSTSKPDSLQYLNKGMMKVGMFRRSLAELLARPLLGVSAGLFLGFQRLDALTLGLNHSHRFALQVQQQEINEAVWRLIEIRPEIKRR